MSSHTPHVSLSPSPSLHVFFLPRLCFTALPADPLCLGLYAHAMVHVLTLAHQVQHLSLHNLRRKCFFGYFATFLKVTVFFLFTFPLHETLSNHSFESLTEIATMGKCHGFALSVIVVHTATITDR